MSKKFTLVCCSMLVISAAGAQRLAEGYIQMPSSSDLHTYVTQWDGGSGNITINGSTWEDEEFFISRVKPKARFYNAKTQVRPFTQYESLSNCGTDKRYLNWVPINDPEFNAIPNGIWDQEVFSMWSYIDHWGDWTSPFGWVPGAFADVAHKNGVAVSGVASVPNASIPSSWSTCFNGIVSLGGEKMGKFLLYHGNDGLGYNSEWYSYGSSVPLANLHKDIVTYMNSKGNDIAENIWYNGVTDSGSCSFDHPLSQSTNIMKATSMFMNYNWNSSSAITANIKTMKETVQRNPYFVYAGMDQQGGQPRSGENYPMLVNSEYSIGLWGAHSYNMFWEGRSNAGSSVEATQTHYLDITERWYTGAARNPAVQKTVKTVRNHRPNADWAGISAMMSARSVLSWDIADEPFITYFNLGNGKFFNWNGERVSDNQWYNIALQDYLPTWRYWFAPEFLQKNVTEGSTGLNATFTWDDAYFGGSCMRITGTSTGEYLHLFKTDFALDIDYVITVRYKLLGGSADVDLLLANDNGEQGIQVSPAVESGELRVTSASDARETVIASHNDGWQVARFTVGDNLNEISDAPVALIGLQFADAQDLDLLIGEISITSGSETETPQAPQITLCKVVKNTYSGVDGKLVWKMPNSTPAGEPVYNSDVNVSMFKVYAQEEGGDPVFLGATTSWAAIAFRAPDTDASKKIRFGVSALSVDRLNESHITWNGQYISKGTYVPGNDVEVDKLMLKPGEPFTCRYVDPRHASSTWTLVDNNGDTVATGNGVEMYVADGLEEEGGYDLYVDKDTDSERHFGWFVQVSSEKVGALPEIYTISHNGTDIDDASGKVVEIQLTDTPELAYTGRDADGAASRALALASKYIGSRVGDLGIETNKSLSVAGWFRFSSIPEKEWNFMNISDKSSSWPQNTWGWAWNKGYADGSIECTFRGAQSDSSSPGELHYTFPDTRLQPGVWTHIAWICEYHTDGFRCQLYINGVKQKSRVYQYAVGNNSGSARTVNGVSLSWTEVNGVKVGDNDGDMYISGQTYGISDDDRVYFGGAAHQGASIDGIVDDFQVWDKAMTAEEVKQSMSGLDPGNLPSGVLALWDFESDAADDHSFAGKGSKPGVKAYSYDWDGNAENGGMVFVPYLPTFDQGCPFLSGTAFPVVTEAEWSDTDYTTEFTKNVSRAANEGTAGSATVKFANEGDHTVTLSLGNRYGADTRTFPVFSVSELSAIGEVGVDAADVATYTVDNVLFLEFAADGDYTVEVYNTTGMLVGNKRLDAVAGQNARITLGAAGVYLVKVTCGGKLLRTVKVLSK